MPLGNERFAVRFPAAWKTLYDAVCPLIDKGQIDFDYETLSELAKIDIRSDRGRGQFYKFRRAVLQSKQVWFENVSGHGDANIPAGDHAKASDRRVDHAKRKLKLGGPITSNVRWNEMNQEQRVMHAAHAALIHNIGTVFKSALREYHAIAKDPLSGTNVAKLLEGPKKKSKANQ
jgi:hypothetical protein